MDCGGIVGHKTSQTFLPPTSLSFIHSPSPCLLVLPIVCDLLGGLVVEETRSRSRYTHDKRSCTHALVPKQAVGELNQAYSQKPSHLDIH